MMIIALRYELDSKIRTGPAARRAVTIGQAHAMARQAPRLERLEFLKGAMARYRAPSTLRRPGGSTFIDVERPKQVGCPG